MNLQKVRPSLAVITRAGLSSSATAPNPAVRGSYARRSAGENCEGESLPLAQMGGLFAMFAMAIGTRVLAGESPPVSPWRAR